MEFYSSATRRKEKTSNTGTVIVPVFSPSFHRYPDMISIFYGPASLLIFRDQGSLIQTRGEGKINCYGLKLGGIFQLIPPL